MPQPKPARAGFEIGKFYEFEQCKGEWFGWIHRGYGTREFYLPTQTVVREPRVVVPTVGRYGETPFYLKNGRIVTYEFLRGLATFAGTDSHDRALVCEVWENHGDDGHVRYCFEGLVFVGRRVLEAAIEREMRHYAGREGFCTARAIVELSDRYER